MPAEETFTNSTIHKISRTSDIDLGSQNDSTNVYVPADYIGTVGVIKQNINIPE
jgi:hypothetical protein